LGQINFSLLEKEMPLFPNYYLGTYFIMVSMKNYELKWNAKCHHHLPNATTKSKSYPKLCALKQCAIIHSLVP
jgi:hypothetical protein